MTELVQLCHEADYNASTGTCSAPYYGPYSAGLPPLSVSDANSIGVAIGLLWATAWGIRRLKRLIDQS